MRHLYTILLASALTGTCAAQQPAVFATGLENPSKIITGPGGMLLVTEATATPNTGRVSMIDTSGNRHTLIDGLPSGPAAPDGSVDGENGLALGATSAERTGTGAAPYNGQTLYIAIGEGDSHVNGPTQGTLLPNPAGPSSPIFSSILKVTFSNAVNLIASGFSMASQDQYSLLYGNTVTWTNATGDTASAELLTTYRDIPDAHSIYRNSHPYGLAMLDSDPNTLYLADAGMNSVSRIDLTSGRSQVVAHFANTPDPLAPKGPPTSEAVPTSVRAYNNHLLVSLLSGAPFAPYASRVMELDPVSGNATLFIADLFSTIDVLFQQRTDGSWRWFVLEYSLGLAASPPAPGALLSFTSPVAQTVATNLNSPSSMALNESTGNLYIADRTDGKIWVLNVGQ